jgi:hypothetical protein
MALGNIFEDETQDTDGLIFVDKDVNVKFYHDGITELTELVICGVLTMNEARHALQRLADI